MNSRSQVYACVPLSTEQPTAVQNIGADVVQDQHLPSLLSLPRMGLPLKASQPIELSTYVSVSSPVHSIWMITCTAQGLAISQLVHILVPGILAPTSKVTKLLIEIRIKFLYTKLIELKIN